MQRKWLVRQEVAKSRLPFGPLDSEEATKGQTHSLVMDERKILVTAGYLKAILFLSFRTTYLPSFSHSLAVSISVIQADLAVGGKWTREVEKILSAL